MEFALSRHFSFRYFFPVSVAGIGYFVLHDYLAAMVPVFLCGVAAIAASSSAGASSNRYGIAMLVLLLISFLIPVKSIFYFAFATGFFFWAERSGRRVGFLGLTVLAVSSPVFLYAANAFSFPIRLQLSNLTGQLFSLWEKNVSVRGNVIVHQGFEFSVDPACMGLHMLSISILQGILFAGLLQRKMRRVLSQWQSITFIILLLVLNILSNLIRIIVLVQFRILPGTVWHEVIGLACLILYVCIPAAFLARFLLRRARRMKPAAEIKSSLPLFLQVIPVAAFLFSALHIQRSDTYQQFKGAYNKKVAGFYSSFYAPGIVKLEREDALVYVKFIRGFYDTEHNPTLCWKGSGYEFDEIRTERIGGMQVFTATLSKDKEKLYTSWW
ncbi:MAG TPA: exosortase N, partial [Flavisolibacter sp.]|nr:exosortase N [Flavisolibacter sp.]